jgi:DNA-binding NarL/FixJ family response regulator
MIRGVSAQHAPIRLALVDDYDIVLAGLARMFDQYQDRVEVVELDARTPVVSEIDIALYDSFAQSEADLGNIETLIRNPLAARVVVYTWSFDTRLIDAALAKGADGYLSKTLPAAELVDALERVHQGQKVVSPAPPSDELTTALDWPGRTEHLTERESEIVALITQGHSNAEIADIVYLSVNSIKSHIRSAYRKMGVTNRVEAVLWGVEHGFRPDYHRIVDWEPSS